MLEYICSNNARVSFNSSYYTDSIIPKQSYTRSTQKSSPYVLNPLCHQTQLEAIILSCVPKNHPFWSDILDIISKVINSKPEPDGLLSILGTCKSMTNLEAAQKHFLSYSLIQACSFRTLRSCL